MIYIHAFIILVAFVFNLNIIRPPVPRQTLRAPGGIEYDVYLPPGNPPVTKRAIMLVHGMVEEGKEHPDLTRLARTLAQSGLTVLVPEIGGFKRGQLSGAEVRQVRRALEVMTENYPDHRKGVMSFRFGNTAVLAALDKGPAMDFLVLCGGYASLRDIMRYALTGYYASENGDTVETDPDENARLFYIRQKYPFRVLPADHRVQLIRAFDHFDPSRLTPPASDVFALLTTISRDKFDPRFEKLPPAVREWVSDMSPERYIGNVTGKVIFFHNEHDRIIPHYESIKLLKQAPSKDKHFFLLSLVTHAQQLSTADLFQPDNILSFFRSAATLYRFTLSLLTA